MLLNQPVFNERPLKTSRVKRLQLTFATLSGSSLLPDISSIFANEGAGDTQGGTLMDETPSEDAGGLFSGFMSKIKSSASGEPTIPRCVLVFIIKGKLYIVKENWNEWDCDYSTCSLEEKKQKKQGKTSETVPASLVATGGPPRSGPRALRHCYCTDYIVWFCVLHSP